MEISVTQALTALVSQNSGMSPSDAVNLGHPC